MQRQEYSNCKNTTLHTEASGDNSRDPGHICNLSDHELLISIAHDRNRKAFEEFYKRHEQHYFNLALRITQNQDLALEATQEAMIKIWRGSTSFKVSGNAIGWSTKILTNESLIALRKRGVKKEVVSSNGLQWLPTKNQHPSEALEANDLQCALREALDMLSAMDQRVIGLYFGSKLSQEAIAIKLRIPQSTISQLIKRTLSKLRADLVQAGFGAMAVAALLKAPASWYQWFHTVPAPAMLKKRTLSKIDSGSDVIPSIRTRNLYWVLGFIGVALLSVPLLFMNKKQPDVLPESQRSTQSVPQVNTLHRPRVMAQTTAPLSKYVYHFENLNDMENDIEVFIGEITHYNQEGFQSRGCLASGDEPSGFKLKHPELRLPLKVTARYKIKPTTFKKSGTLNFGIGIHLLHTSRSTFFTNFMHREDLSFGPNRSTPSHHWRIQEVYFQKDGTITHCNGKLFSIHLSEEANTPPVLINILGQILIDHIVVEELPSEHLIDLTKFKEVRKKFKREDLPNRITPIQELTDPSQRKQPVTMQIITP